MKRVFLDEGVPRQIAGPLQDVAFTVSSIALEKWTRIGDGELLRRLEGASDVLVTNDRKMYAQQNLVGRTLAIIALPTNRKAVVMERAADIVDPPRRIAAGQHVVIEADGRRIVQEHGAATLAEMPRVQPLDRP
jgi:hypothetical protein